MRSLMVFIILLFGISTFGFGYWLHLGSSSADEKLQTFLSYSLSITAHFLSLLTIFISIATITRDIKHKQLFTVATKPVSRGGYLAGKLLGMALLNLILLSTAGGTIYGLTLLGARIEPAKDINPIESRLKLEHLILVAREAVHPSIVGVTQQQIETQAQIEAEKRLTEFVNQYYIKDPVAIEKKRKQLVEEWIKKMSLLYRSVLPGGYIVWRFEGIKPVEKDNGLVFIRYKHEVSPNPDNTDLATTGTWAYGSTENVLYAGKTFQTRDVIRTPHEFPVPNEAVSEEGNLYLAYENHLTNSPVIVIYPLPGKKDPFMFTKEIGIEALYVAGGFTGNFIRGLGAIYLRLLFLAMLGIALAAWLSFPVAVLTALVIFMIGLCSYFILSSIRFEYGSKWVSFGNIAMMFLPKLAAYDPVPEIEKGRLVSKQMLGSCLLILILIKGGIISFIGYLIFRFRELARVIA